jgi:hypothetical protein
MDLILPRVNLADGRAAFLEAIGRRLNRVVTLASADASREARGEHEMRSARYLENRGADIARQVLAINSARTLLATLASTR